MNPTITCRLVAVAAFLAGILVKPKSFEIFAFLSGLAMGTLLASIVWQEATKKAKIGEKK